MTDPHQFEYSQITNQIYIGSDLCQGAVCPIHTDEFSKLGICGEINLEVEHPETPPQNLAAYLWLPVADRAAPSPDQLVIGTSAIDEMVRLGNKVYIHCRNGHGRSPTLVAAYLVRYQGISVATAIQLIKQQRPEIHLEEVQLQALEEFAKQWK